MIFRALVAKEAAGEKKLRTKYDLDNGCQSYLNATQTVKDGE